jgi:hypothetical protein
METVLIERLLRVYSFPVLLVEAREKVNRATSPIEYFDDNSRHSIPNYDSRRIAFFVEQGKNRGVDSFSPIEIDTKWYGRMASPGAPIVTDGHHRLAAAIYLGAERIPSSCGGLMTTIDWLTGKTDEFPNECL